MNKSSTTSSKNMSNLPSWLWPNSSSLPTLYKKIWEFVQEGCSRRSDAMHNEMLVDTNKIFPLLLTSQLPTEVLGFIWSLANQKYAGQLTEQELYIILALVALAQTSCSFDSLEVLQFIHTPPIPSLNLSFINVINNEPKVHELSSDLNLSSNNRKHESLFQPTNKLDDLSPNTNKGFNNYNNLKVKDIKFSSDQQSFYDLNEVSFHPQTLSDHPETKHPSSYTADSADEFSDFQSAPITNTGVLNIWDSKQGSAIGSRLANHNLGVKKSSDKTKKSVSTKNNNSTLSAVTNNFSFANKDGQFNEQSSDHFLKCSLKNQTKTVILKDTAIRNRDPTPVTQHSTVSSSSTVEQKVSNVNSSLTKSSNFPNVESQSTIQTKKSKENESQQDLMSLQPSEDKYSALRALVDEPTIMANSVLDTAVVSSPVDDFGDFVSAEQLNSAPTEGMLNTTNSLDLSSHFDSDLENITSTCKSSPNLIEEISDVFDALSCNQPIEKQVIDNLGIAFNLGKLISNYLVYFYMIIKHITILISLKEKVSKKKRFHQRVM